MKKTWEYSDLSDSPMLKGCKRKALWSQSIYFNVSNEHIWIKQKSCRQVHNSVKILSI